LPCTRTHKHNPLVSAAYGWLSLPCYCTLNHPPNPFPNPLNPQVARGDLGAELPLEEVPFWQSKIIQGCR